MPSPLRILREGGYGSQPLLCIFIILLHPHSDQILTVLASPFLSLSTPPYAYCHCFSLAFLISLESWNGILPGFPPPSSCPSLINLLSCCQRMFKLKFHYITSLFKAFKWLPWTSEKSMCPECGTEDQLCSSLLLIPHSPCQAYLLKISEAVMWPCALFFTFCCPYHLACQLPPCLPNTCLLI